MARARRLSAAGLTLGLLAVSSSAPAQTVAITGATIYPVSGPKLEHGTIVIVDGKITAVGTKVSVPSGATQIDATGRWITPGFVQTGSTLGIKLLESGGLLQTAEDSLVGDVNAAFNVSEGIDPASLTIPVARSEGITATLAVPSYGLIRGQGVWFDLSGDKLEDLLVKSPVVMVADLSETGKGAGGGSRAGSLQKIRRALRDALEYSRRKEDFRRGQMQPLSESAEDLEALEPVVKGQLPVLALANRRSDIENALRLAQEFKLRLVIWGGAEAWQMASDLAAARLPVVVEPLTNVPTFDALSPRLDNAALLRAAGVTTVLAQHDMAHFRDLRQAAGNAVRNGLSWDDALRGVTLAPAEVFGVQDRYGSLEPGKMANLVVWSGDPFEFSSAAEHIFIRGRDVAPVSRQTQLRDRYRELPPRF